MTSAVAADITRVDGELPEGWAVSTLDDVVDKRSDIVDGPFGSNLKSAHYTSSGARVVRLQNIGYGSYVEADAFIDVDHYERLSKHNVIAGDLLFASLGEKLPRTCLAPKFDCPAIVKADCIRVRLSHSVNPMFVLYATQTPDAQRWASDQLHGMGRPRLGLGAIRSFPFPLPTLGEQEQIVAILEEQLSRLDAALASVQIVREKAAQFRRSLLHAAFTGALTGHDVGQGDLPDGWERTSLGAVAKWGSGGTPKSGTAAYYGGSIPWAVIGDLTEGLVTETAQTITEMGLEKSSAKVVKPGTVLLAMYGASIGRTGVAGVEMATNQAIAYAQVDQAVIRSDYLLHYLQSQKESFVKSGQGGAQPNISQTIIKGWSVALPPISEQHQIVAILEEQLSRLDATLAAADTIERQSAALRRSLLNAAFTGKLTERWRQHAHA